MVSHTKVPQVTLHNGITMPQLGLGVWRASDKDAEMAVKEALRDGYRLIDTAAMYRNEAGVGRAVLASEVPREEIFITTKLWNSEQGYDSTLSAFEASLTKLGLDYIDLYLIHWPAPKQGTFIETWKAFEKLYADKRVRAIGVSNFTPEYLEQLMADASIIPMVNQIELHPKLQQHDTRDFCLAHNIHIESYSPIMRGGDVLDDPTIKELATSYNKEPAQIVLKWHLQQGLIPIPKSVTPSRIASNIELFDFELSDRDIEAINALDEGVRLAPNPDTFD